MSWLNWLSREGGAVALATALTFCGYLLISGWQRRQHFLATCPHCQGREIDKVIYAGLPMRFCKACASLYGTFARLIGTVVPFNGTFMGYRGSYVAALWHWLTHPIPDYDQDD